MELERVQVLLKEQNPFRFRKNVASAPRIQKTVTVRERGAHPITIRKDARDEMTLQEHSNI